MPPELRLNPVPEDGKYILDWFYELHRQRTYHQWGPNPITWADIAAWAQCTGRDPSPLEVDGLIALDLAYRAVLNAPAEPEKTPEKPKANRRG